MSDDEAKLCKRDVGFDAEYAKLDEQDDSMNNSRNSGNHLGLSFLSFSSIPIITEVFFNFVNKL